MARALSAITAIGAASLIIAQPAGAWGVKWRPRRHHTRLGEWERQPDLGRYSKEALEARDRGIAASGGQGITEGPGALQQLQWWAEDLKATLLRQEQKATASRRAQEFHSAQPSSSVPSPSSRNFSPLATGALVLAVLLGGRWLWGVVRNVEWGKGGRKKGKWVRDRGLGGKMVFVPEDEVPPPRLVSNTSTAGAASPVSVSGRTAPADPWAAAEAKGLEAHATPSWWSPPPQIYVDPFYRKETQVEAQAVVNKLMNGKIAGHDYDIGALVGLRQLCGETGATVDAKTQRDPIFRAAADAAAHSAAEQINQLGGQSPGKFLAGMANDLGIEEKEAVNMVNAVVASQVRSALITACAGYRERDNNEVLVQLLKLAGIITALPLPEKSAHAEMVAAGLQQRATLPERQAIFLTYGCMDPPSAGLVAELLGFQPELVIPQLEKHIEEGRRGAGKVQVPREEAPVSKTWEAAETEDPAMQTLPSWWSAFPDIYVDPLYVKETKVEAQAVVDRLIKAKNAGHDYDIGAIIGLRQLCGDTGATVDASAQRDQIFRAAASAAVHGAEEHFSQLGGQPLASFLVGIAHDLGVDAKEAISVVSDIVGSRTQSALTAACAGYQGRDSKEVLVQLLKLAGLVTALPLPERSSHVATVAASLQQEATMPERQAIFLTYGCMDPLSAGLVAELLGFQPELVLPQLEKHIEEGSRGAAEVILPFAEEETSEAQQIKAVEAAPAAPEQTVKVDPWATVEQKAFAVDAIPSWWSPPPQIYVDPFYKRETEVEAQAVVDRLINAKNAGHDYNINALVGLRQLCGETGASVDAKSQREQIFRAAADAATYSASEQIKQLGGQSLGRFVAGIASDVGLKDKDALNIANSTVASQARSALVAAFESYRERDNGEVLVQLLKLAGLVTALPLPDNSTYANTVAIGLQQQTSLPERQAIFLTYGCMDPPTAGLVAELLGFQPALVVPQLEKHIEDGRRGPGKVFVPPPVQDVSPTFEAEPVAAQSDRTAVADPWVSAKATGRKADAAPSWWSPLPQIYVDPAYRKETQVEAQAVVKRLMNLKDAGHDYDLGALVGLRQLCGETGATVDAKGQRDEIFRAAADAAAHSAAEQINRLGGQSPGKFLASLASDLGLEEGNAIDIANSVVASQVRAALTAACEGYRVSDSREVLVHLLKLAGLTAALPLPEGSSHTENVAASLQKLASLPERQAIFLTYGCMDPLNAGVIAELLGFQPALVFPQLERHIAEGRRGAGNLATA